MQVLRPVKLSPVSGNQSHPVQHFGDAGVIAYPLAEMERFFIPAVGLVVVGKRLGKLAACIEGAGTELWRGGMPNSERLLDPGPPLAGGANAPPESPE